MDKIRKFISSNIESEDVMEVDIDFTDRYLSQFETIDREIIEVLIENGYQTKEHLLALDLSEDLPMLPVLNMAQKSLLRKVLKQFHENDELEYKIYDLKGEDSQSPNSSAFEAVSPINKRKRDSGLHSSIKRLRSSLEKPVLPNDGLGNRMRQMVNKRKPIHSLSSQTDSEPEFLADVIQKRFQFGDSNQMGFGIRSNDRSINSLQVEEEEDQVVQPRPKRGRPSKAVTSPPTPSVVNARNERSYVAGGLNVRRTPQKVYESSEEETSEEEVEVKQEVIEPKRLRGRQSLLPNPTPPNHDRRIMALTARKSIRTPFMTAVSNEKTTPKSNGKKSPPTPHIPTPTELEVRERLAQKKALAQPKSGRKRR